MSGTILLTFNPGSSTIKLGLFSIVGNAAHDFGKGTIDLQRKPLQLRLAREGETTEIPLKARVSEDLHELIDETLAWLAAHFQFSELAAVGHRVVHGGDSFSGPARISDDVLATIDSLVQLAPLHQPQSMRLIKAIRHLRPELIQIASFDTAFHQTQAPIVRRFALPRALFDEGVKRYGFHGLSYKYIADRLAADEPELAKGRIVVAHLGSGASLCALQDCVSRDTSMGFSTLDGIPMATRCGTLDPGVLLHLLTAKGLSATAVEDMLYHHSGLLGVSGLSADSRVLLASAAPAAREAIELFTFRIARETTALANTLGGLDGLVFTAGIGEHQPEIREAVCRHLAWLGVAVDPSANAKNATRISQSTSRVAVLVIPTDEEQVIADEALALIAGSGESA